jgi:hypothetical protein
VTLPVDPQSSWLQWGATAIVGAFSGLIGLFVSFGRDAHKIYRDKVDALEKKQAEFSANFISREDFKGELDRLRTEFKAEMSLRFESIDNRHLQMHNHNATLLGGVEARIGEFKVSFDKRMGELREDIKDLYKRSEQ